MPERPKLVFVEARPSLVPACGARRGGPRSRTHCELPPGHEGSHLGRDTAGRWQSWEAWTVREVARA